MQDRPVGVTILAILVIVEAILGIIGGLFTTILGTVLPIFIVIGIIILVLAIVELVVGVGLLRMRHWAWTVAVVITVIRLVADVISLFQGGGIWANIISIVFNGLIFWYLFRPDVRNALR